MPIIMLNDVVGIMKLVLNKFFKRNEEKKETSVTVWSVMIEKFSLSISINFYSAN